MLAKTRANRASVVLGKASTAPLPHLHRPRMLLWSPATSMMLIFLARAIVATGKLKRLPRKRLAYRFPPRTLLEIISNRHANMAPSVPRSKSRHGQVRQLGLSDD